MVVKRKIVMKARVKGEREKRKMTDNVEKSNASVPIVPKTLKRAKMIEKKAKGESKRIINRETMTMRTIRIKIQMKTPVRQHICTIFYTCGLFFSRKIWAIWC